MASPKTLQIENPIEGEHVETDDYFFCRLGDSIPITLADQPAFDTNAIPSKPLAVSSPSGLIFAAHSSGFCVAKTKDVIAAAKEIKAGTSNSSVQELSIVDVDIGSVSILALSEDSGYLSAVIGDEIHIFSVESLLDKDKKPTFSCSAGSNNVKDMLWLKDSEQSFIIVTDGGKLHLGAVNKPLICVMEKVDAVEKSVDGKYLAVGRKNNLTILSSQLEEMIHVSIPLDSFTGDNSASDTVKVESIKWVRDDSIVVGCLQQTEGSDEENFLLQVIMSEDGKFIYDSSAVTAVQFSDLFPGIIDDIVPYSCGPNLFMNYLENCEFAFVSNRKNTDQHITLLSWSQGDNRVSVVDIERDSWLPRIELQENGDDNLVLGICVDEAPVYGDVEVKIGAEEHRDLRPHCLLVCLTLEGKLVMFNVGTLGSISGCQRSSQTSSSSSDNVPNKALVSYSNVGEGTQSEEAKKEIDELNPVLESDESNSRRINSAPDDPAAGDGQRGMMDPNISKPSGISEHIGQSLKGSFEKEKIASEDEVLQKKWAANDGDAVKTGFGDSHSRSTPVSSKSNIDDPAAGNGQRGMMDPNISKPSGISEHIGQSLKGSFEKEKIASEDEVLQKKWAANDGDAVKTGFGDSHSRSTPVSSKSNIESSFPSARSPFFTQTSTSTKSNLSSFPLTPTTTANNDKSFSGLGGVRPSDSAPVSSKSNIESSFASARSPFFTQTSTSTKSNLSSFPLTPTTTANNAKSFSGLIGTRPSDSASSSSQISTYQPSGHNPSKQFDNVENIAKELDKLLEGIEDTGGFRDIFTSADRSSLETLEDGMRNLSERSRGLQSISEEQLRDTELLLDKTVQVLARKTHMEGIVRQTTDGQYWDLWDRQKLSSELDHKQQTVLNLYQDLVNKMIELEKHFNTLELNLFGETNGTNLGSRALSGRSATHRHSQSLNAIHNATVSQLAAAEQLSDLLSRQMAVLSVKSPSSKKLSVKKQVFETIGIPCPDDYLNTTNMAKMFDSPPNKSATHNEFRRSQLSGGGSEFETSRRRRDSLDRNWAKFEAPKTTVKRMPVPNEEQNGRGLFSSMDKRLVKPRKIEASLASPSKNHSVQYRNGGNDSYEKSNSDTIATSAPFKRAGAVPETSQLQAQQYARSSSVQGNNFLPVASTSSTSSVAPSLSPSLSLFRDPNMKTGNGHPNADRSGSQWGLAMSLNQSTQPQPPSPPMKFNQMPNPFIIETKLTKPDDKSSSHESTSKDDIRFSSSSRSIGTSTGSSSLLPTLSAATFPVLSSEGGFGKAEDSGKKVSQIAPSIPVSSSASPSNPISHLGSLRKDSSSMGSSVSFGQDSLKPLAEKYSVETNLAPSTQSSLNLAPPFVDKSKSEGLTPSSISTAVPNSFGSSPGLHKATTVVPDEGSNAPTEKQSTAFSLPSLSFSDTGGTVGIENAVTISSKSASIALPEKQSTAFSMTPVSLSKPGDNVIEKNISEASPTAQEDEMEEEAPETNQTSDFSLGNLAGFGLGSAVSASSNRPNPFGVSPQSTSSSSPFTVPQGQMFRPASFSFPAPVPQQSQSPTMGATSGTFGSATSPQKPLAASGFGQPGQIGVGGQQVHFGGQQALGSVLGSFGQSRQIGVGLPGSGFGGTPSTGGFSNAASGGGFAAPTGGFAGASVKTGGFAGISSTSGGFAGAATPGSGFAAAAPSGGGFAAAAPSGGFAAAGSGGGGFGVFSNQGTGGFSAIGAATTGGRQPSSELFTQMRR